MINITRIEGPANLEAPMEDLDLVTLAQRALGMPDIYAAAERSVLDAHRAVVQAKRALSDEEERIWGTGGPLGKNADERKASLQFDTAEERTTVEQAELRYREAQAQRDVVLEEMKTVRAVLHALGGGRE